MAPKGKKVVKIMNQKGQKGNKVTMMIDERINKKGKTVVVAPQRGAPPSQVEIKAKKKAEQAALEAQNRMLFKAAPSKAELEAKRKAQEEKEAKEKGDAYAHLQEGEEDYRWTAEDFEPVEVDETRLEEQLQKELEELREKLASGKIKGTKVTPESFKKWKEQKRKEKILADKKAKIKAIRTGALTGKMLYEMDESLFKDDDEADEVIEREDEVLREAEEAAASQEAETAGIDASLFAGDDLDLEDVDVE
uniref:ZC3H15/TMA46 family C-terminal domain-containing protein n=1 Tax=Eutreptiella gymnastica TaxID=73025 RepID=A0A7S1N427_9EUGL